MVNKINIIDILTDSIIYSFDNIDDTIDIIYKKLTDINYTYFYLIYDNNDSPITFKFPETLTNSDVKTKFIDFLNVNSNINLDLKIIKNKSVEIKANEDIDEVIDSDYDSNFIIHTLTGKTIKIDPYSLYNQNLEEFIKKIAEKLKVHPIQIELIQDGEIIKYDEDKTIFDPDIKHELTCIIKELPILSICYIFYPLIDCYCSSNCGIGKFIVSISNSDDDCYVLTPDKCLHYIKVENIEYPECDNGSGGGYIRYEKFKVGLISDTPNFAFNSYDFKSFSGYGIHQVLTYYDALSILLKDFNR